MRSKLIKISEQIAKQILQEEFEVVDPSGDEKQRQNQLSSVIKKKDLKADGDEQEDLEDLEEEEEDEADEEDEPIEAKPKPEPEKDKSDDGGEFNVEAPDTIPDSIQYAQIEKQVNNLRAGKSLKDEAISGELEAYFDSLGKGETQALFSYLSAIGAILTGGTSGKDSPRPSELGINIEPEKKDEPSSIDAEVGTIRSSTDSAPIVVGELANKYSELERVFENHAAGDKHRCMGGKIVDFGSSKCIQDLNKRIKDMSYQRDNLQRSSADRSSLNGTLKFLRKKLRSAEKIKAQKVQAKTKHSGSA